MTLTIVTAFVPPAATPASYTEAPVRVPGHKNYSEDHLLLQPLLLKTLGIFFHNKIQEDLLL